MASHVLSPSRTELTPMFVPGIRAYLAGKVPFQPVQSLVWQEIAKELDAFGRGTERQGAE